MVSTLGRSTLALCPPRRLLGGTRPVSASSCPHMSGGCDQSSVRAHSVFAARHTLILVFGNLCCVVGGPSGRSR
jgi:hypothetical protein